MSALHARKERPPRGSPRTGKLSAWALGALLAILGFVLWLLQDDGSPPAATPLASEPDRPRAEARSADATSPESSSDHAAGDPAPERMAIEAVDGWTVRGELMHGTVEPLPGVRFRAQLFAGGETTGEPLADATLTSAADGTFEWAIAPPTGVATLTFASSDDEVRILPNRRTLLGSDGPPQDLLVFGFRRDCRASGTVTDEAHRPIAGAWVKGGFDDPPQPCAADGTFELRTSATYGETTVHAGAPGHVMARQSLRATGRDARVHVDFVLRPAARLAGRVTDEDGAPIAGALVFTFETRAAAVHTDADGRFELANVDAARERHVLQVEHDEYLTAQRGLERTDLDRPCEVVLQRGARVTGRVFGADNRPIAGAHVHLGPWTGLWGSPKAVSREDGTFVLRTVREGRNEVVVFARGHAPARQRIVVPHAGAELTIRLEAGHFVAGRVVDRDGNGLHRVRLTPFGTGQPNDQVGYVRYTARDGSFRIEDLPAGTVELDCFGRQCLRKHEAGIAVDRADVAIVVDRPARLAGRVVDDLTGSPLTRFTIRLVDALHGGEPRGGGYGVEWQRGVVFEDTDGYWTTDDEQFDAGRIFGVEASAPGYGPAVARGVAEVHPARDAVVLRLRPPARITGRVVDKRKGAAIAGARVAAIRGGTPREGEDPFQAAVARTDAQGGFVLAAVQAGEVSLVARLDDRPPLLDGPFEAAAGATVHRVLAMPSGATLRGTVVDLEGAPVAGLQLVRESIDTLGLRLPRATVATGADGRFTLTGLPAARVWLHGSGSLPDGSILLCSREVDVAAGDDLDVRLQPAGSGAIGIELVAEGQPLPELPAALELHVRGEARTEEKPFATKLPRAGAVLRGLPAGTFRVSVHHFEDAAMLNGSGTVTVVPGATVPLRIAVRRHSR